ncbi:S-layer homology domain-containing protein [Paenibacillus sp. 1P07SE]|uniref:S-layer homology domain-containing protein n=1 Tax=Paenibacillus sp. 1P07SE TaxID=3132209 RepID=UPI0039A55E24
MKQWKQVTAIILMMVMLVPYMAHAQEPAAAGGFTDIRGHWAEETILKWAGFGLVKGQSADRFNPNASITRAELAALINNVTEVEGEAAISFTDVAPGTWYYIEVSKAVEAGYMQGYADGTFKPTAPITRQELAVLITRLLGMDEQEPDASYADVANAPAWSKGAIGAVIQAGIMSGTAPGRFAPLASTTRAEAVVTLDRIAEMGNYVPGLPPLTVTYDEAGTYGGTEQETVEGAVIISAADVVLQNTTIAGDLTITASVGEGDVTLQGVVVQGRTLIQGGGENSIRFKDSTLGQVEVNKAGGKIRVVFDGTSKADRVRLQSPAKVEAAEGSGVGEVELGEQLPSGSEIALDGSFARIVVSSEGSNITADNGTIGTFQVNKQAKGSKVSLGKNSKVTQLTLDSGTSVTGDGTVDKASINAEGTTLAKKPGEVAVADGIQASVGGSTVSGKGTTAPPAAGGGAIGGGGGGFPNPGNPGGEPGTPGPEYNVTAQISDVQGKRLVGEHYFLYYSEEDQYMHHGYSKDGVIKLNLPEGTYWLISTFTSNGDSITAPLWFHHKFTVSGQNSKSYTFQAKAHNVDGILRKSDNINEADAAVVITEEGRNLSFVVPVTEEAFGLYLPDGKYSVTEYSDLKNKMRFHQSFAVQNGEASVTLNIPSYATGTVKDKAGNKLSEGTISLSTMNNTFTGYVRDGQMQVRASNGWYPHLDIQYPVGDKGYILHEHQQNVIIRNGKLQEELIIRGYNLKGTIEIEGMQASDVSLLSLSSTELMRSVPIHQGEFYAQLPPGTYEITGYYDQRGVSRTFSKSVVIDLEDKVFELDLKLKPTDFKQPNVKGSIRHADGAIVEEDVLRIVQFIEPYHVGIHAYIKNGRFDVYLEPGRYSVEDWDGQVIRYFTIGTEPESTLDVVIHPPNVRGKVFEYGGEPIYSGGITLLSEDQLTYNARIKNSKIELYLPDGTYQLSWVYSGSRSILAEGELIVKNGVATVNPLQQWTMPKPEDPGPEPNVTVQIYENDELLYGHYYISIISETTGGSYTGLAIDGLMSTYLPAGNYIVRSARNYFDDEVKWLAAEISVRAEGDTNLDIHIPSANVTGVVEGMEELEGNYELGFQSDDLAMLSFIPLKGRDFSVYLPNGTYSIVLKNKQSHDIVYLGTTEISGETTVAVTVPSAASGNVVYQGQELKQGTLYYTTASNQTFHVPIRDGEFELRVPDGEYSRIEIRYDIPMADGDSFALWESFGSLSVEGGEFSRDLRFTLKGFNVIGTIEREQGDSSAQAYVQARSLDWPMSGDNKNLQVINGQLYGYLQPGRYVLTEYYVYNTGERRELNLRFDVLDGETTELKIPVKASNVFGELLQADGTPVTRGSLQISTHQSPEYRIYNATIDNGEFDLYLPDGAYLIQSYISYEPSRMVELVRLFHVIDGKTEFLNLADYEHNFSGTIESAEVGNLLLINNESITYRVTVRDGAYSIHLPDGTYNVLSAYLDDKVIYIGQQITVLDGEVITNPLDAFRIPSSTRLFIDDKGNQAYYRLSLIVRSEPVVIGHIDVVPGLNERFFAEGSGSYTITGYAKDYINVYPLDVTLHIPETETVTIVLQD